MSASTTVKLSSIMGNRQNLDGGSMFGNVPQAVWSGWHKADAKGRIQLSCRAMLIEIGEKKILCETGIGAFFEPKLADRFGVVEQEHVLLESLRAIGIEHTQIDAVILSHLHFDHAGGLLEVYDAHRESQLLFPNATFVVGKEAFARACHPHMRDRASFIPGLTDKLIASQRLLILDRGQPHNFYPKHLSFRFTDGHTPGQMHTMVRGSQRAFIFAGDLVPGLAWVHLPVTMGYDRNAELVIDEKKQLYDELLRDSCELFFTHDPEYAGARLQLRDGKYSGSNPIATFNREAI